MNCRKYKMQTTILFWIFNFFFQQHFNNCLLSWRVSQYHHIQSQSTERWNNQRANERRPIFISVIEFSHSAVTYPFVWMFFPHLFDLKQLGILSRAWSWLQLLESWSWLLANNNNTNAEYWKYNSVSIISGVQYLPFRTGFSNRLRAQFEIINTRYNLNEEAEGRYWKMKKKHNIVWSVMASPRDNGMDILHR